MRPAMTSILRAGAAIAAFCACLGANAIAQQPARLPGTFITGQVLPANSNTPLRRVRIDVTRGSWRAEPILTDNEGRFSIDLERAGPVSVTATKGGFLVAKTTVQQADLSRPLLMHLPRGAVITGTAFDENGQPAVAPASRPNAWTRQWMASPRNRHQHGRSRRLPARGAGARPIELQAGLGTILQSPQGDVDVICRPFKGQRQPPASSSSSRQGIRSEAYRLTVPVSRTAIAPTSSRPAVGALPAPGGVRGRVLTAARKPVVAASVRLTGPASYFLKPTDTSGAFSFAGLRPGRYTLEAIVNAFGTWGYGQDGSGRAGTPIVVADRIEEGIDIVLPQYIAIQGIVLDEHGEPVPGCPRSGSAGGVHIGAASGSAGGNRAPH